jgi:hypothetical protein
MNPNWLLGALWDEGIYKVYGAGPPSNTLQDDQNHFGWKSIGQLVSD